jgi:hypothetical protein
MAWSATASRALASAGFAVGDALADVGAALLQAARVITATAMTTQANVSRRAGLRGIFPSG